MLVLVAALASTLQLASAEPAATAAPTPIAGPITISQSGDYIVTQDFTAVSVPAIQFAYNATATVTIDFDGHKVEGSIVIRPMLELGDRSLTIKNGEYVGSVTAWTTQVHGGNYFTMTNMTLTNSYVWIEDGALVATHCRFVHSSVTASANWSLSVLSFQDNEVIGGDVRGEGSHFAIIGNEIQDGSILMPPDDGWGVSGSVVGNILRNGSIVVGEGSVGPSYGVDVASNDVSGYIAVSAHDSWIEGNIIRGCGPTGASVSVGRNPAFRGRILANNFAGRCNHGIYFGWTARDWVYGDNTFRFPVPQPIVDDGENNRRLPSVDIGPE